MDNSNFKELMKRYFRGQVTGDLKTQIDEWTAELKKDNKEDLELSPEAEERIYQNLIAKRKVTIEKKKVSTTTWTLRIAASLALIAVITAAAWLLSQSLGDNLQFASNGGVEKIVLNDGTIVWLQEKSSLTYFDKTDEGIRYTELEGEALFEVAKDSLHPFIIQYGDMRVRVVGTSFSIKTSNDSIQLKVLTGKVNLSSSQDKVGLMVEPNEKVIYTAAGPSGKETLLESEKVAITAHTEYNMNFIHTKMSEVIRSLEKKFDITIKLSNENSASCRVTVDLTDHSLEESLGMIPEMLDVTVSQDKKVITLSGKGCDK